MPDPGELTMDWSGSDSSRLWSQLPPAGSGQNLVCMAASVTGYSFGSPLGDCPRGLTAMIGQSQFSWVLVVATAASEHGSFLGFGTNVV